MSAQGSWYRRSDDVRMLLILYGALGLVLAYRSYYDDWLSNGDILTFFLPWFGHLGDRLRSGDIPGWMPWVSSGSPFAGDPSAGWGYLPAMLTFSILGATAAFKAMILIQSVIGGTAIYAFSRLIGLRPIAALVGAFCFTFGPYHGT